LQQTWLLPGTGGTRGAAPPRQAPPVSAVVTMPTGERVEGVIDRIDDFVVSLTLGGGTPRSFRTDGESPQVEKPDHLASTKQLLRVYTDNDIHNVSAYLVTLK